MNKQLASLMVTLLILPIGIVTAQTINQETAQPQSAAAKTTVQQKVSTSEKAVEPINGAFGLQLGEPFKPSLVAKVLTEKEHNYRGAEGADLKGMLYQVKPNKPDEHFQNYFIKTTNDGLIYAIQGIYQYDVEPAMGKKLGKVKNSKAVRKTCKTAVKSLAEELEPLYGKPRGKGWEGEWYSFRQFSESSNKSLKLYANRCRTGQYSILYTDKKIQQATQAGKANTSITDKQSESKSDT